MNIKSSFRHFYIKLNGKKASSFLVLTEIVTITKYTKILYASYYNTLVAHGTWAQNTGTVAGPAPILPKFL